MPQKEPLTRTAKGGNITLTDRAKDKLRGQIARAERIIRIETDAYGKKSKAAVAAVKMRSRAKKLLNDKSSPGEKVSDKRDKYQKRREPIEKATGVYKIRKALEAVGKAGLKKNGG